MCTIGNVFLSSQSPEGNITFKQCDLTQRVTFLPPQIIANGKIRYIPFLREGSSGPWAGINEYGVSFVAADSYIDKAGNMQNSATSSNSIFDQYLNIIKNHTTAAEATQMMRDFYIHDFKEPDILMISDSTNTFFIETYNGEVQIIQKTKGFFASANHFRMVYGAIPYNKNHSTYLRLARAESILEHQQNKDGVFNVLSDQYYGESVWSICRVNKDVPHQEEPYFTQASVIFTVQNINEKVRVDCSYIINGNPLSKEWIHQSDIFKIL